MISGWELVTGNWKLFVQRCNERRNNFKQVARDTIVGDLEDRCFGILVDSDNRARAFHADEMLNGAGDAKRDVQLRRDGLARAADLPIHRQPAGITDRTRGGNLGAERLGKVLGNLEMFLPLDASTDGNDTFRL